MSYLKQFVHMHEKLICIKVRREKENANSGRSEIQLYRTQEHHPQLSKLKGSRIPVPSHILPVDSGDIYELVLQMQSLLPQFFPVKRDYYINTINSSA